MEGRSAAPKSDEAGAAVTVASPTVKAQRRGHCHLFRHPRPFLGVACLNGRRTRNPEQIRDKESTKYMKCPTCGGDVGGGLLASPPSRPCVLTFATIGAGEKSWCLTQVQIDAWTELYPGLDVLQTCRKAKAWVDADLTRRKTAKGMTKFLVGVWLNRDIDRRAGGDRRAMPPRPGVVGRLTEWECPLCGLTWMATSALGGCPHCRAASTT